MDNIKMGLVEIRWGGMDLIDLTQYRDQWKALMNAAMNFGVHKMLGCSSVTAQLVGCQEGLSSMELH
jgi:hypothetical protein